MARRRSLSCLLLVLPIVMGCKGENSATTTSDVCEEPGTCAASAHPDTTLKLANLGEEFGFGPPSNQTNYGQPGCDGHFVLDLERLPEDGNVALNVTWDASLPTTPCEYQMDLQVYGFDGSSWAFLGETRQKSGYSSGVCVANQTFRCGGGQEVLTGPGFGVTDPRYVTVRAAVSVLDEHGGRVLFQVTGQKWR